jgi:hypothetical protein
MRFGPSHAVKNRFITRISTLQRRAAQENEHHLLRFLCEDAGKRLDYPGAISLVHAAVNREKRKLKWSNLIE